jgi:hypothetical protein
LTSSSGSTPEPKLKEYYVLEAVKGTTTWLVRAANAKEARANFFNGDPIDSQIVPNGVREVRLAREETRNG